MKEKHHLDWILTGLSELGIRERTQPGSVAIRFAALGTFVLIITILILPFIVQAV